jgi:tetratricopeptide (TPR) repeat protein
MEWFRGDYTRALHLLEDASRQFHALGDEAGDIATLDYRAKVLGITGHFEEEARLGVRVVEYARLQDDPARLMSGLVTAAWGALNSGQPQTAQKYLEEGIALGESLGAGRVVAMCRGTLPFALLLQGRAEDARAASEYSLQHFDARSGAWAHAFTHGSAAIVALALGDIGRAQRMLPDAVHSFHAISTRWEVASALGECGNLAVALGDHERAAQIYGAAEALRHACGHVQLTCLRPSYETSLAALQAAIDKDKLTLLWQHGTQMPLDDAVALTDALRPASPTEIENNVPLRLVG